MFMSASKANAVQLLTDGENRRTDGRSSIDPSLKTRTDESDAQTRVLAPRHTLDQELLPLDGLGTALNRPLKILMDQTLYASVKYSMYFAAVTTMDGGSAQDALDTIHAPGCGWTGPLVLAAAVARGAAFDALVAVTRKRSRKRLTPSWTAKIPLSPKERGRRQQSQRIQATRRRR